MYFLNKAAIHDVINMRPVTHHTSAPTHLIELICQALTNLPGLSVQTAVTLGDYAALTDEIGEYGETTLECWREWEGRIWWVQLFPEIEEGVQIVPVDFPGDRPDITPATLNAPGKPTLAQLGL